MMPGRLQRLETGEEHIDEIGDVAVALLQLLQLGNRQHAADRDRVDRFALRHQTGIIRRGKAGRRISAAGRLIRSEEHTSELQSQSNLVCRLLLEKKNPVTPYRQV